MRRPCRRSDQLAAGDGLIHRESLVLTAGGSDFGAYRWIATARFPLQHARGGQNLRGVADCGDGLIALCEMAYDLKHVRVKPKVLGRTAARNHERVVIAGDNFVKGGIQSEVVTALLAISLVPLEVVDGGPHRIARPLLR